MSLFEDMEQEKVSRARMAFYQSGISGTSPAEARANYNSASRYGITPSMLTSMSHEDRAKLAAEKDRTIEALSMDPSNAALIRSLGDTDFVSTTKDDLQNMSVLEKVAWKLAGDPGDPTGSVFKTLRNSAARGALGGFNTLPYFGNADKAAGFRKKRDELTSFKERLDNGEDPRKVFNMGSSYTDAQVKANVEGFRSNYEKNMATVEENLDHLADRISYYARSTALFPQGAETEGFRNAKGAEAARELFLNGNFWMNMFNMGPESLVQYLPTAALVAATSIATGGAGATAWGVRGAQALAQFLGSSEQDRQASLLGYMADRGVNIYDSKAVAQYLKSDPGFQEDLSKADRHATGTGAGDAFSILAGALRLPFGGLKLLPRTAAKAERAAAGAAEKGVAKAEGAAVQAESASVKPGARPTLPDDETLAQQISRNAYANAAANFVFQGQVQGLLGAGGEAAGQLLAEGEITSVNDILAEYAGEHFTAPLEMVTAGAGARKSAQLTLRRAVAADEALKTLAKTSLESKVIQESPQIASGFMQTVGEMNPDINSWEISFAGMSPEEVAAVSKPLGPGYSDLIAKAATTGGTVQIDYATLVTKLLRDPEANKAVVSHVAVLPMGDTNPVLAAQTLSEIDKQVKDGVESEVKDPTFRSSLANVGRSVDEMLKGGGVKGEVRESNKALIMTHVSNMANETGLSPEQVWGIVGLAGVEQVGGEVQSPTGEAVRGEYTAADRMIRLVSGKANRATLLHEGAHWFLDARVKLAIHLMKTANLETLTPEQKRFLDITNQAVRWASGLPTKYAPKVEEQAEAPKDGDKAKEPKKEDKAEAQKEEAPAEAPKEEAPAEAPKPTLKDALDGLQAFANLSKEAQTEAQEKFARTYEQYLKTGHAPTAKLMRVFARFTAWLKGIYQILSNVPGAAPMNEETVKLFDDLFTAGQAVEEARLRRQLLLDGGRFVADKDGNIYSASGEESDRAVLFLPDSMDEFGNLTDAAIAKYVELRAKRGDRYATARGTVLRQLRTKAYNARAEMRKQAKRELGSRKEQQVYDFFHGGDSTKLNPGQTHRIRASRLRKLGVPKERVKRLIELRIASERPQDRREVEFAAVAERFGYGSADEFATAFDSFAPMDSEMINQRTQELMEERFPELSSTEDIATTADRALFTPTAARAVAEEIRLLDKSGVKSKELVGQFLLIARGVLSAVAKRDLSPAAYRRNAENAAKMAIEERKKYGEDSKTGSRESNILLYKRQELLQMQMALYAEEALNELGERMKAWRKAYNGTSRTDAMPVEYLEQIQALLWKLDIIEKDGFGNSTEKGLSGKGVAKPFAEFATEAKSEEHRWQVPPIPANLISLLNSEQGVMGRSIDDLTLPEIRSLIDFVTDLENCGKRQMEVELSGRKIKLQELQERISDRIHKLAGNRQVKDFEATDRDRPLDRLRHGVRKLAADHIRVPAFLEGILGGLDSAFDLIKPGDMAAGWEVEQGAAMTKAFLDAMAPLMPSVSDSKVRYYPALDSSLTKTQLIAIALNMGNEENIGRLTSGSNKYPFNRGGENWTKEALIEVIGNELSAEELNAVQAVWDVVGSLKGELFKLERSVGNRIPQEVPAEPITFVKRDANGNAVSSTALRGGYYPVSYDVYLNPRKQQLGDVEESLDVLCARKGNAVVRDNRVKARGVGDGSAISLTFRAGTEGLQTVIHDIAWRKTIADYNKIFDPHGLISTAIREHYGQEYVDAIQSWIKDTAEGGRKKEDGGEVLAGFLRQGLSVAMLGFSPVSAVVQALGITQSIAMLDGKWVLHGFSRLLSPEGAAEFRRLSAKSSVMRDRRRTQFRELAEAQRKLGSTKVGAAKDRMTRMSYALLSFVQLKAVDCPTWMAAYEKAKSENPNLSEGDLILRADRALIDCQGSGRRYDLSRIERGGTWAQLFTVMYSFFNTTLNLTMQIKHTETDKWKLMWRLFLVLGVQSALDTTVRGFLSGKAEDDDDWYKDLGKKILIEDAKFVTGLVVGLRELNGICAALAGEKSYGYSGPTGTKAISDAYKLAQKLGKDEYDIGLVKAAVAFASDIAGAPGTQINRGLSAWEHNAGWPAYFIGYKESDD